VSVNRLDHEAHAYLSSYANLTALISSQLYRTKAPAGVSGSYCVLFRVSRVRRYSHDGYSGLTRYRLQISCFAPRDELAKQVAEQVTAAMEAWPSVNPNVQSCEHVGEQDLYESDVDMYHIPVDFLITYPV
jgi:hypothetical protein